jgi:hypothetical protein
MPCKFYAYTAVWRILSPRGKYIESCAFGILVGLNKSLPNMYIMPRPKAFVPVCLAFALLFSNCKKQESSTGVLMTPSLPRAPEEVEEALRKEFPGVMTGPKFGDSILRHLADRYHITPRMMLLGTSTCVDDIIYTKNFHLHPEINGPFHLGGLGGWPFTGVSGLEAFAHHVPDSGAMVLIVEPHIGYSANAGWGYILRPEQTEPSSCCGALVGTLRKLQKGTLTAEITEDDYQGGKIAAMALRHEKEIQEAQNPIVALTKMAATSAEDQIRKHVLDVDLNHIKYIVIITGVLIDTDYQYCDYQSCDHLLVYDVGQKKFVEELRGANER